MRKTFNNDRWNSMWIIIVTLSAALGGIIGIYLDLSRAAGKLLIAVFAFAAIQILNVIEYFRD